MSTLRTNTLTTLDDQYSVDVQDLATGLVDLAEVIIEVDKAKAVESISQLRALTSAPSIAQVIDYYGGWAVRAIPAPQGGGMFDWDPTSVAADNGGTVIKLTSVATGRYIRRTNNLPTIPQWWGALGDGVHDDTSAIQSSVDWAQDNGGHWYLPGSKYPYYTTQTIQQTKRLTAYGAGMYNSVIESTAPDTAWKVIPPYLGASNIGYTYSNFGIRPRVENAGTYGLRVTLQPFSGGGVCFFADCKMDKMFLGPFNNGGLYLDNSVANTDGFFTSQFEYCTIVNGVKGVNLGDSLTFGHNKVYGKNCGFNITGVAGARQMIIEDNNVTTHGGLIQLQNVEEVTVRDNQLEHPGYLSGYTGTGDTAVLFFNCYKPRVEGNTINPDNGAATAPSNPGLVPNALAFTGTTNYGYITQNDINKGAVSHIALAQPTVTNTFIDELNTYYGAVPVITNSGTNTTLPTLRASKSFGPQTIAINGVVGDTIGVVGANPGDYVQVEFSESFKGCLVNAWVPSTGLVALRIENVTGAVVNLGLGTLKVKVSR